ncbi:hypothetical protein LTR39_005710, partial [Cryomyces antarcticus]
MEQMSFGQQLGTEQTSFGQQVETEQMSFGQQVETEQMSCERRVPKNHQLAHQPVVQLARQVARRAFPEQLSRQG